MKRLSSLVGKSILCMASLSIPALAIAQPKLFVELGNTGKLLARGAAVAVSVRIACTDETEAQVQLSVVQRRTEGTEFRVVPECNGTRRFIRLFVQPDVNQDRPFNPGRAAASALLMPCEEFDECDGANDAEQIQIRRKQRRHKEFSSHLNRGHYDARTTRNPHDVGSGATTRPG